MKKIKYLVITILTFLIFDINVFAASGRLSVSSGSVYVGDSFTISAQINSVAAWNVHVSASGPVSECTINQANATDDALDTNKTFTATCTATSEGTITIVLSGDVTSAANGNAIGISDSKSVTVSTKPAPTPNPPSNNNNNTDSRSKNNNLKELSVEGYDLVKVDANNYTLSVPNDVSSINIKATAEDSNAKVRGEGNHNINVGDNSIEVIITAENGSQNKINIKVTRKDGYYLEDLNSVLNNNRIDDINITIKNDTALTSQDLEKIKSSKRRIRLNYYDENRSLLYSWVIEGSKIKNSNKLLTSVSFETENKKEILKSSNYADGLFVNIKQSEKLPDGIKLRIYVGSKYSDEDRVNIYYYDKNNNKLTLTGDELSVKDGYVEFDTDNGAEYFISMSKISNANYIEKKSNLFKTIAFITTILLAIVDVLLYLLLKKKNNNKISYNSNIDSPNIHT